MRRFEPPDNHHLSFAIGWMELGNAREARSELTKLTPEAANHPDVLEVRWAVASVENDWADALQIAERLQELDPTRASAWLHRAYAMRRVKGGGINAAWDALLPAVDKFPSEPTIPYNLACYACQLGQLDEARQWLLRARNLGERARIKSMALADDDLKPFWAEIAEWEDRTGLLDMSFSTAEVRAALKHLRSSDPVLRDVIERVGPFRMKLDGDRFRSLVRSIISQQISGSSARAIRARLEQLLAPAKITPRALSGLSAEQLRGAGLSPQKARYLLDLATKVERREVRLRSVARWTDQAVIEELLQVKGIGVWTAQMFLMFSLGRMDVFPHDDLGIRSALRNLYELKELPDRETSHRIAAPWRPYATMASWYCWRSLELAREGEG